MTAAPALPPLPPGWKWTELSNFCEIILGQSPDSSTHNEEGVGLPFFQGKAEFGDMYPTIKKWCSEPKKIARKDDVLISVRAPVGPTNICPENACIGRGLAAIRGKNNISSRLILYMLRTFQERIREGATGTTFEAITGDKLKNLILPLPPLADQQRIVDKIEELFTQLDAAEAALLRALQSGRLGGAALDAFSEEPPSKDNPLLQQKNLILTPHIGAHTDGAANAMGWGALKDCLAVLRGEEPQHRVA
jgi:restriction endonuclease S subunit